jgi:fermentation-respiration switch protein FrsA (DUF1100 family)
MIPVKLLSRYRYPTTEYLKAVNCPVLIIHSTGDEVVPFSHGKRLFEEAPGIKHFLEITGNHNSGYLVSESIYTRGLSRFLEEVRGDSGKQL